MKRLFLILLIIPLISCSFSDKNEERKEKAVLPTLILENAQYVLGQQGEKPITINSKTIEFYDNDNLAIIKDFYFEQRSGEETTLEGQAEYGRLNTYSKNLELNGNVRLVQKKENMEISADSLSFNTDKEEISADGFVMVKSKDGVFQGSGFFGDLKEQVYSFSTIEEGSIDL